MALGKYCELEVSSRVWKAAKSGATNPSSDAAFGTLKSKSLRSEATYCSSTLRRSYSLSQPRCALAIREC
jgi:hypothetical protein